MKKVLTVLAAAAVLAAGAVAEVTVGTSLSVQNALVASDGDDTYAGTVNSWGGARYAAINIEGTSEDSKAGFKMDIFDENGSIERGDNAYLWVQPIDQIMIVAGQFDSGESGLQGDFCYGSWNWIRPYNWLEDDEGLTFTGALGEGLHVQIWPINGLQIYIGIPLSAGVISNGKDEEENVKATYISSQVAVAYTIEPISSTVKVQWVGDYQDGNSDVADGEEDIYEDGMGYGTVELAFDFGLIPNLFVTAGFRYRVMDGDLQTDYEADSIKIALGASYELGNLIGWDAGFTLYASGVAILYTAWDIGDAERDPRWSFGVGADLGIIEGLKVEADFRYLSSVSGKYADGAKYDFKNDVASFLIGAVYSVGSNGEIGIGFQGATNGWGFLNGSINGDENLTGELQFEDKFAWAIPLRIGMWL